MDNFLKILAIALLGAAIGCIVGYDIHKSNVKTRALGVNAMKSKRDTLYSQKELEYIIFGESQE